jgi:hypothetical protein
MFAEAEHIQYTQLKLIKSIVQYVHFCNYICIVSIKEEGSSFALLIIINQRRTRQNK